MTSKKKVVKSPKAIKKAMRTKWFVGNVERPNAGGMLYNACQWRNGEQVEFGGRDPTYDSKAAQQLVDTLNSSHPDKKITTPKNWKKVSNAVDEPDKYTLNGLGEWMNEHLREHELFTAHQERQIAAIVKHEIQHELAGNNTPKFAINRPVRHATTMSGNFLMGTDGIALAAFRHADHRQIREIVTAINFYPLALAFIKAYDERMGDAHAFEELRIAREKLDQRGYDADVQRQRVSAK